MSLIVPSSKTEAGQQHLAQFNNKKTTKNAQFEHRKIHRTYRTTLQSRPKCLQKKNNMAVHPLSTFTPAPSGR
jgi:hypothetical protein